MTAQTLILPANDPKKRERAAEILKKLPLERAWDIVVKPFVQRRSTTQNARLWLLHTKVGNHLGMSAEDMHEIALARYFGFEEKKVGGIIRHIPLQRSSPLNKKEFNEFMEATEAWYVTEFGIFLE